MSNFKRVLIKLSGESLSGGGKFGFEDKSLEHVVNQLKKVYDLGIQISIVLGGGNIWRGKFGNKYQFDQSTSDDIGMLATTLNGLVLSEALRTKHIPSVVMGTHESSSSIKLFARNDAIENLEKGKVLIFIGGLGVPCFSTDSAAAVRCVETKSELILKATKVNGVYSADPMIDPNAKRYDQLTYQEALNQQLNVMDSCAFSICQKHKIPICVFSFLEQDSIYHALNDPTYGSWIR